MSLSEKDVTMREEYMRIFKEHLPETCPLPVIPCEDGTNVLKNGDKGLYFWTGQYCSRIEKYMKQELIDWEYNFSAHELKQLKEEKSPDHKLLMDMETDVIAEKYNLEW